MLILHVDIDFFVDPVVYYRTDVGPRPSGRKYRAEPMETVTHFIEKQCRLDRARPLGGVSVVHNDEVFVRLSEFRERGLLEVPFEMIHVDAHADLGVGDHDRSFDRISTDILHRPVAERAGRVREGMGALGFGNWLAYCLACRWVDRLTIVRHPLAGDDLHPGYFAEYLVPAWQRRAEQRDLNIRMQPLTPEELSSRAWQRSGAWGRKLHHPLDVPLIPTRVVTRAAFQLERTPDLLFLCLSPGYSPRSADRIFHALERYLDRSATRARIAR